MPLFSDHHLRSLLQRHLVRVGTGPDIAQKVADNLVEASLKGHDSHGVTLLPRYIRAILAGDLNLAPRSPCCLMPDRSSLLMGARLWPGVGRTGHGRGY